MRRRRAVLGGALWCLVFAVYLPSLSSGFIWDDDAYVTENATLKSFEGLERIWLDPRATPQYYPLVFTTFWVEYHLWGLHPAGYHFTNAALHATNALLVWLVLRRLSIPGAWFAAAVFGLHPVHVESVSWMAERKNVLSGCFYLLALPVSRWARRSGQRLRIGRPSSVLVVVRVRVWILRGGPVEQVGDVLAAGCPVAAAVVENRPRHDAQRRGAASVVRRRGTAGNQHGLVGENTRRSGRNGF